MTLSLEEPRLKKGRERSRNLLTRSYVFGGQISALSFSSVDFLNPLANSWGRGQREIDPTCNQVEEEGKKPFHPIKFLSFSFCFSFLSMSSLIASENPGYEYTAQVVMDKRRFSKSKTGPRIRFLAALYTSFGVPK